MNIKQKGAAALVLLGLLALLASSCDSPTGSAEPKVKVRALPGDLSTRKAVSYSGFRGSSNTQAPSLEEIKEDLNLLDLAGFKLLRLFSSSDDFSKTTLEVIRDQNYKMKVQLGVWIEGSGIDDFEAKNQAEITRGVKLAQDFKSVVIGVSVGNEKLVSWQGEDNRVTAAQLIGYIKQVRNQVSQPVTTDDNWAVFANDDGTYQGTSKDLLSVLDYVSLHTYPLSDSMHADMRHPELGNAYWDWFQKDIAEGDRATAMMNAAIGKAKSDYKAARDYMDAQGFGNRPIVIGETGWKSEANDGETMRAHPINQKMYLDGLADWTGGPQSIIYFEAFDEPWKGGDDKWGLFTVGRKAKYALHTLITNTSKQEAVSGTAVYYSPPPPKEPVTSDSYAVYVDSPPEGMATPSGNQLPLVGWIGWDQNPVTASGSDQTTSPPEGGHFIKVTPSPKEWGWGFFAHLKNLEDLSNYEDGHLNFTIRTTYTGKLMFGFHTDDGAAKTDCYLAIASGEYGYANDGDWHQVSIPIVDIIGQASPNLHYVDHGFTVADKYETTGKASGAAVKTPIELDNIYWSKN